MNLSLLEGFIEIARTGSLSLAARKLGLSKATLSRQLQRLEEEIGLTLIERTTRKLHLTESGQRLYTRAADALDGLQELRGEILEPGGRARGSLTFTVPVEVGTTVLAPMLKRFEVLHPEIDLSIRLSDERLDLLSEGIDLALRAGKLEESRLKALRLGTSVFRLYASESYLKARGRPSTPAELVRHRLVGFSPAPGPQNWKLRGPKETVKISVPGHFRVNHLGLARQLTELGVGIALLPRFLCESAGASGSLIPILPDWRSEEQPFSLVYKADRHQRPSVRTAIDFFGRELRTVTW